MLKPDCARRKSCQSAFGQGFDSPQLHHKDERPATLVVAGFPCIRAGLRAFCIKKICKSIQTFLARATKKCNDFRHEIRYERTGSIRSRLFHSSHHHTVSLLTPATAASSWVISMSTCFPITPTSRAMYVLSPMMTVLPVGITSGSVATQEPGYTHWPLAVNTRPNSSWFMCAYFSTQSAQ